MEDAFVTTRLYQNSHLSLAIFILVLTIYLTGGGVDDEIIEVVEKSIPQVEQMVNSPGPLASPPSCLFALMWFLHHKADKYRK